MINPDYPKHPYRIKKEGEVHIIFDEFRKLWVKLTPEEWVRQNLCNGCAGKNICINDAPKK
jgi:hypothetical protein